MAAKPKTYIIQPPNGPEEEITNLKAYCLERGLKPSNMVFVAHGIRRHHKGYRVWEKENKIVYVKKPRKKYKTRSDKKPRPPPKGKPKPYKWKRTTPGAYTFIPYYDHPKKYYFFHPETNIKYQVFAFNRRCVIEALIYNKVLIMPIALHHLKKYLFRQYNRKVNPTLPTVIHYNYSIGKLKEMGFTLEAD